MTRAVNLANLADSTILSVDAATDRVGIGSTQPTEKLEVVGVVSATSFFGDGSGLTGVASTDNIITGTAATFTGSVNISGAANFSGITTVGILTAYTSVNVTGVVTATNVSVGQSVTAVSFHGDGSQLSGISQPTSFDVTSSLFI
tara:strand:- start:717 stop:1151 length:435 start_codon:yes stop_codon:yes gene_type:complete